MRDYGIVSPRFWIGETGKKLRGDANCQVLAMYLMTSPHATMTGVYHCPVLYMAHETGLSMDGATKALARLIHEGYCLYDEASEYVFVLRMAAHQIGESLDIKDRRVIGLRKDVEKMQEPFKSRFLAIYGALYHLADGTEIPSPSEAPSEPHRSQDQDQDQDQKQDQKQDQEQKRAPPKAAKREDTLAVARLTPGLDLEAWDRWLGYRAERKPAIKACSAKEAAEELAGFGKDQMAVVKQSIAKQWQGLFALHKPKPIQPPADQARRPQRFPVT